MTEPRPVYLHGASSDGINPWNNFQWAKAPALSALIDANEAFIKKIKPEAPFNHAPSREFLIGQAVMNAVAVEMPCNVKDRGIGATLAYLRDFAWIDGIPGIVWQANIRHEFYKLSRLYDAQ